METIKYDETQLNEAAKELAVGNLVAFPTETVYGLELMPFYRRLSNKSLQ